MNSTFLNLFGHYCFGYYFQEKLCESLDSLYNYSQLCFRLINQLFVKQCQKKLKNVCPNFSNYKVMSLNVNPKPDEVHFIMLRSREKAYNSIEKG